MKVSAGGNRRHIGQPSRHRRVGLAPLQNRSVHIQREALRSTCGNGDNIGGIAGHVRLAEIIPSPGNHDAVRFQGEIVP